MCYFLKCTACKDSVCRNQRESGDRLAALHAMRARGQGAGDLRIVRGGGLTVLNGRADVIGRGVTIGRRGNSGSAVNLLILRGSRVNPREFRQKIPGVLHFVPILPCSAAELAAACFDGRPVFLERGLHSSDGAEVAGPD